MKKINGYLFAKLERLGSKSEGPEYYLQLLEEVPGYGPIIKLKKQAELWQEDENLHPLLGEKILLTSDLAISYNEVEPYRQPRFEAAKTAATKAVSI